MKHASKLDPALTGNRTPINWLEAQCATTELALWRVGIREKGRKD